MCRNIQTANKTQITPLLSESSGSSGVIVIFNPGCGFTYSHQEPFLYQVPHHRMLVLHR